MVKKYKPTSLLNLISKSAIVLPSLFFSKSKSKASCKIPSKISCKQKEKDKENELSTITLRSNKKIIRKKDSEFTGKSFTARKNLYWTPKEVLIYATKYLMRYNPNIKKIADPFTAGKYHEYIQSKEFIEIGSDYKCEVIAPNKDFFFNTLKDVDLIISNPPYTSPRGIIKDILDHNFNILKIPFAYLLPLRIQCEEWFDILVKKYELQIFFPNENRVSFKRGKTYKDTPGGINVFWVCWKCNLPDKITYKKNLV